MTRFTNGQRWCTNDTVRCYVVNPRQIDSNGETDDGQEEYQCDALVLKPESGKDNISALEQYPGDGRIHQYRAIDLPSFEFRQKPADRYHLFSVTPQKATISDGVMQTSLALGIVRSISENNARFTLRDRSAFPCMDSSINCHQQVDRSHRPVPG